MPIRWNTLKVKEAADMVEDFINQSVKPLECARNVAREALKIDNLPQYIEQGLNSISAEIERVTGREDSWDKTHRDGSIKQAIDRLRSDIPKDALKSAQVKQKQGEQQTLV